LPAGRKKRDRENEQCEPGVSEINHKNRDISTLGGSTLGSALGVITV
jgi:hypothetical protein